MSTHFFLLPYTYIYVQFMVNNYFFFCLNCNNGYYCDIFRNNPYFYEHHILFGFVIVRDELCNGHDIYLRAD